MPKETPYSSVAAALAKQSAAINALAREIKQEFSEYRTAVKNKDAARADAIADAIDKRTQKLIDATAALESTHPDAGVDNSPGDGGGFVDAGLPGVDRPTDPGHGVERPESPGNALPGWERPTDPGHGIEDTLPGGPDNTLPNAPARPGNALPEAPVDPGWGGGRPSGPPSASRPDVPPARPGGGPVLPDGGNKPVTPDEPGVDNTIPGGESGTKPTEPGTEPPPEVSHPDSEGDAAPK